MTQEHFNLTCDFTGDHQVLRLIDVVLFDWQARDYLVAEEILRAEVTESLWKVQTTVEILQLFRSAYEDRRANLSRYQQNGRSVTPWDFPPLLVFSELDQFISKVNTIKVSQLVFNEFTSRFRDSCLS